MLAILLYAILADAAVETFLNGSPGRWITAGVVAAYAVVTALSWRRSLWATRAVASAFMLLFLLALTAWLPDGVRQGLALAGQRTSAVLALATAVAVLLAGAALGRSTLLPLPARWAAGIVAAYGAAAFLLAITAGADYADLFHGMSLWVRLPFWLQGAFIGALILVPGAAVYQIATGLRLRGAPLRLRGLQVAGLGVGVVLAVAGLRTPVGFGFSPTETRGKAGIVRLSPVTFARGQSGSQPVGPAQRLQQGIKAVYAFVEFEGLTGEDTVGSVWYKGANELSEQKVKVSENYKGSVPRKGRFWFILPLEQGAQPGGYFLQIYINDILAQGGILLIERAR